jgi:hypothetical protein
MKSNYLSKVGVAFLFLWATLGNGREIECIRFDHEMRQFDKLVSYLVEKIDKEKRRKQEAEEKEAQRRYQIFQAFLENQGILGRTSVLKDFYSGRYK